MALRIEVEPRCKCGGSILCQKTGECSKCYQTRRRRAIAKGIWDRPTDRAAKQLTIRTFLDEQKAARLKKIEDERDAARRRVEEETDRRAEGWAKEIIEGARVADLARRDGLTRERIRQVLAKRGYATRPPKGVKVPLGLSNHFSAVYRVLFQIQTLVDRSGGPDACWPWTGSTWQAPHVKRTYRYGRIRAFDPLDAPKARHTLVHRAVYLLFKGPIPKGKSVDHICFNPLCCNPAHLQLLTPAENSARKSPEWYQAMRDLRGKPKKSLSRAGHDSERGSFDTSVEDENTPTAEPSASGTPEGGE